MLRDASRREGGGEKPSASPSLTEVSSLADLIWSFMDAEEAAQFLGVESDRFYQLAPPAPATSRSGWRYLRGELLAHGKDGVGQREVMATNNSSRQFAKRKRKRRGEV